MRPPPPSQARILLLLVGSVLAGLFVASQLSNRLEKRPVKPIPQTEQSLAADSP